FLSCGKRRKRPAFGDGIRSDAVCKAHSVSNISAVLEISESHGGSKCVAGSSRVNGSYFKRLYKFLMHSVIHKAASGTEFYDDVLAFCNVLQLYCRTQTAVRAFGTYAGIKLGFAF